MSGEFLTAVEEKRYVIFPIQHKDMWDMYKQAQACDWKTEEIDLSQDQTDWEKVNNIQR